MNYEETIDFLFERTAMFQRQGNGAYKPGLGTTLALAGAWDNPHTKFRTIHVGGTNGKGSTAHTLAAVLQSAGYRTGLYTSPHLLDFRERIRVDGEMVSRDFVVEFVEEFLASEALVALSPSFFELVTIMAFAWFARQKVDVAVVEVGLGGRLDSTNIISPELSVITNISLDHTALLGNTEAEIAGEKAGIIKPGVPVVIGEAAGAVREVFESKAREEHAPIVFAQDRRPFASCLNLGDLLLYKGTPWGDIEGELCGACQSLNGATIMTALEVLKDKFAIDGEAVRRGFAHVCELTGLMGRWMEVEAAPVRVVCDTGHNVGGWQHLGSTLAEIAEQGNLHIVIGFVNDKDIAHIVDFLPRKAKYYFVCPSVERGRSAQSTAEYCTAAGLHGKAYDSVAQGFEAAKKAATPGDTIFVGGSTFVVADFLALSER